MININSINKPSCFFSVAHYTMPLFFCALCAPSSFAKDSSDIDALTKRSPFIPAGYVSGAAAKQNSRANIRLEFGGYAETDGRTEVSVSNTTTGESIWVPLRDKNAPYYVESFDAVGMSIAIKLDGAIVRLPLRTTSPELQSNDSTPASQGSSLQPVILDPGSKSEDKLSDDKKQEMPATSEPNRIPRQTLRIPKRVDDPS